MHGRTIRSAYRRGGDEIGTWNSTGSPWRQQLGVAPRCSRARQLLRQSARSVMKTVVLNLPTFGFVVATRAMLGAGLGLLLSERLSACLLYTSPSPRDS